jgi:MOB kinase activator 1
MNLRIDMLEYCDRGPTSNMWLRSLGPCEERDGRTRFAKSKNVSKSPLQKLGEALQIPQAISDLSAALAASRIPVTTTPKSTKDAALRSRRQELGTNDLAATGTCDGNNFADTGLRSLLSSNPRTRAPFKPQKSSRGTSSWQLKQYAEATLGSGSLRKAVKLPEGEDKDEWLAVNSAQLTSGYKRASLIYNGSRRFLQPDQPALRFHYRILLATELS